MVSALPFENPQLTDEELLNARMGTLKNGLAIVGAPTALLGAGALATGNKIAGARMIGAGLAATVPYLIQKMQGQ
jgi:hypothetical protein